MDQPQYLISDVARVTGVSIHTLRSWFNRGHVRLLETDARAESSGLAHYLSLRSALRVGAMGALVVQGVSPALAGQAALWWTDVGDAEREPGELFKTPATMLCIYPDGSFDVKHAPIGDYQAQLLLWSPTSGSHPSVTALTLDNVDRKVRTGLEPPNAS